MKLVKFNQSFFHLNMFECSHRSLFPSFILKYLLKMLILRQWQVFIMPIFIIKTNVFQHKTIRRFNIWSFCLDLCIPFPKLIDVGQRDCKTAWVLCAGSCCLPPQRKVTFWNSEFWNSTIPVRASRKLTSGVIDLGNSNISSLVVCTVD